MGADGKVDTTATFAKVDQARAQLEQRMGEGGLPPEKPDGYKPDAVYAAIKEKTGKELTLPPELLTDLGARAHALKLTQTQYEGMVGGLMEVIPNLVTEGFQHAMKTGAVELAKVWGPAAHDPHSKPMQYAFKCFSKYAPESYRNAEGMDSVGNHPLIMQLLANVGKDMPEDRAPNDQSGTVGGGGQARLDQLVTDPAYNNRFDPRHAAVYAEATALFQKGFKTTLQQEHGTGVVKL